MRKMSFFISFSAFVLLPAISQAQDDNIIPNGLVVESYQGGWQSGGSDPTKECLAHFNQKYPTKRTQIIDSGEDSKKDLLGHVEYKYRCTAAIKTQ